MKILCAVLLLVIPFFQAQGAQLKSDRERHGLRGLVRQVIEGEIINFRTISTYDRNGNISEITWAQGNFLTRTLYTRNERGDVVMRYYNNLGASSSVLPPLAPCPFIDKDSSELYDLLFHYYPVGRLEAGKYIPGGFSVLETGTVKRDASPSFGREAALAWRILYYYDRKGRLIESVRVNANELVSRRSLYVYEGEAIAPQSIETQADGRTVVKERYQYEYDSTGNWVKRTRIKQEPFIDARPRRDVTKRTIIYY